MATSSVDTFLACSLMVTLIVSSMAITAKVVQPHIDAISSSNPVSWLKGLADYMLLGTGNPEDWGQLGNETPPVFGLASQSGAPYQLDLDKVSRLNNENIYAVSYVDILSALGTEDTSLNIKIHPLFSVSAELGSSQSNASETTYTFRLLTQKSGFPVSAWLTCYTFLGPHIQTISSSTTSDGVGSVSASLPNSLNGTALFVVFAEATTSSQLISFTVHSFSHNSEQPWPNRTFVNLSPLNHTLSATFLHPGLEISHAYVFSSNFRFNLTLIATEPDCAEYAIPRLQDSSPMILIVSGTNNSTPFAEWTAYPQVPLEVGADFTDVTTKQHAETLLYIVAIDSVLYETTMTLGRVQGLHA